jgi:hypothetical protein
MSTLSAPEFLTIFQTCREHWRRLLELSRRQMAMIEADDYPQLLSVLGQKQRILGHLDDLKQRYPGLRERWLSRRGTIDPELSDDCNHVLAETEAILAQLMKEEQISTERLTGRRDKTQQELQAISNATEVHKAYRDGLAPATHRHLDVDR